MRTWKDVQAHVRERYEVAFDRDRDLTLVFEQEDGRRQAAVISTHEAMGRVWCDFSSACCRADQLSAEDVARRNFRLAAGSIALDGDVYVVRYTVPLVALNPSHVEMAIHVVTATATRIETDVQGQSRPQRDEVA